jgi:hypothetical protein
MNGSECNSFLHSPYFECLDSFLGSGFDRIRVESTRSKSDFFTFREG